LADIIIKGGNEAQTMALLASLMSKVGLQIIRVTDQYELAMPAEDKPKTRRNANGDDIESQAQ
jgi:hypothetical protein